MKSSSSISLSQNHFFFFGLHSLVPLYPLQGGHLPRRDVAARDDDHQPLPRAVAGHLYTVQYSEQYIIVQYSTILY